MISRPSMLHVSRSDLSVLIRSVGTEGNSSDTFVSLCVSEKASGE